MSEIWKDISGYDGDYQVSNMGRVKSLRFGKERLLKPGSSNGYFHVVLFKNKKQKNIKVHRLVAQAFIKNPQGKRTINHINGIKTDNRLSNLEWATQSENLKHAFANGLSCNKGENGPNKLTKEQVLEIRRLCAQGMEYKSIISKLGLDVHPHTISDIKLRKRWLHI